MIIAGIVLSDSDCPFNALIACALLSGVGGGAFASSMSNISFYYPKRLQGMVRRELFFVYSTAFVSVSSLTFSHLSNNIIQALGYNGGLGNLGVSISQLLAPIFMSGAFGKAPVAPSGISGW